jgi:hypothetical protein
MAQGARSVVYEFQPVNVGVQQMNLRLKFEEQDIVGGLKELR